MQELPWMNYAVLILVAASLLAVSGGAVAPGVCIGLESSLSALLAFVSDPQPDLIIGPGGFVDATLTCPP